MYCFHFHIFGQLGSVYITLLLKVRRKCSKTIDSSVVSITCFNEICCSVSLATSPSFSGIVKSSTIARRSKMNTPAYQETTKTHVIHLACLYKCSSLRVYLTRKFRVHHLREEAGHHPVVKCAHQAPQIYVVTSKRILLSI